VQGCRNKLLYVRFASSESFGHQKFFGPWACFSKFSVAGQKTPEKNFSPKLTKMTKNYLLFIKSEFYVKSSLFALISLILGPKTILVIVVTPMKLAKNRKNDKI